MTIYINAFSLLLSCLVWQKICYINSGSSILLHHHWIVSQLSLYVQKCCRAIAEDDKPKNQKEKKTQEKFKKKIDKI